MDRIPTFWLLVLVTVLVVAASLADHYHLQHLERHANQTECLEDQPCWDCSEMGNRVCGPLP